MMTAAQIRSQIESVLREVVPHKSVLRATSPAGKKLAHEIFASWTDAVAYLAQESGMTELKARRFGEGWIARVQGSLILHAATGDCRPFERAMNVLADLAKAKSPRDRVS